jgi:hypothetical protein
MSYFKTLLKMKIQKPSLLLSSGTDATNMVNPLDQAILSHWTPHKHSACLDNSLRTALAEGSTRFDASLREDGSTASSLSIVF